MDRVGFGKRLLATLLDAVILIIPLVILSFVFSVQVSVGGVTSSQMSVTGLIIGNLISLAYTSLEIFKGATPGKMILKLQIRNDNGIEAVPGTLATRWAIKQCGTILGLIAAITGIGIIGTLSTIAGLVIFIGCFFVLGANRQAFHDMIAKTAVYRTDVVPSSFEPIMTNPQT